MALACRMNPAALHHVLLYGRAETRRLCVEEMVRSGQVDVWPVLVSTIQSSGSTALRARCLEALGVIAGSVSSDIAEQILTFLVSARRMPSTVRLSRRETEVAALIARGLSNRAIGAALGITPGTVNVHVEHILDKLSVPNRAAIGAWVGQNCR